MKQLVRIAAGSAQIEGMLEIPEHPLGLVLFAHGSGSSRLSPRNNYVAGELRRIGLGTLLMDLLTSAEDQDFHRRFDIQLLAQRLDGCITWLLQNESTRNLPIGLFGASTGAAAALQVAAERGDAISAVVSRGGRPDLAGKQFLNAVSAPTLFIVGGDDKVVIDLNRQAFAELSAEKRLEIVPGATHLFEEPGKLEEVAALASEWFIRYLAPSHVDYADSTFRQPKAGGKSSGLPGSR